MQGNSSAPTWRDESPESVRHLLLERRALIGGARRGRGQRGRGQRPRRHRHRPGRRHVVQGNFVGTDKRRRRRSETARGISSPLDRRAHRRRRPGEANVIAWNKNGVVQPSASATRSAAIRSSDNAAPGIDNEPARRSRRTTPATRTPEATSPELSDHLFRRLRRLDATVHGILTATPATTFDLDFFDNPSCTPGPRHLIEGADFLGSAAGHDRRLGRRDVRRHCSPADRRRASRPSRPPRPIPAATPPSSRSASSSRSTRAPGRPRAASTVTITGTPSRPARRSPSAACRPRTSRRRRHDDDHRDDAALPPAPLNDVVVTNTDGTDGHARATAGSRTSSTCRRPAVPRLRHDARRQRRSPRASAAASTASTQPTLRAADGGLPAEGQARPLLHAAAVHRVFAGRPLPVDLRRLDRGARGGGHHRRLRRRQLLPAQPRPARPDGRLPAEGRARLRRTCRRPAPASSPTSPARRSFADWIEQLAAEGITGGCGSGNYCPLNPNTRGQMAVFLEKTFRLQ